MKQAKTATPLSVSPLYGAADLDPRYVEPKFFNTGMDVYLPVVVKYDDDSEEQRWLRCTVKYASGDTARIKCPQFEIDQFVELRDVAIKAP